MKKKMIIIFVIIVIFTLLISISTNCQQVNTQQGFAIEFNSEGIDTSVIYDDVHYVPIRTVYEKMGAHVFYRSSDSQILALSRDGDMISHILGSNIITLNGKQNIFDNSSISENGKTYIPIDMVAYSLCPDEISYDNHKLSIKKQIFNNYYHLVVKDVLDLCRNSNFYPERFHRYINCHVKNPDYNMQEVIYRVNLGLDYAFYENVATIEHPYELLVLINKYNQLPAGFTQYNLVNMDRQYTSNDGKQYLLAGIAYEKYIEMNDAAKKEGLSMKIVSAYRTEAYQRNLYNSRVRNRGKVYADKYSARPGFSEHQTGLAVDINSTRVAFEYSDEFKWLQKHAHEYGFILRYPKGKEWITGYAYEPWHYRYVGVDVAKIIYEEGITYEEYYAKYISSNDFM